MYLDAPGFLKKTSILGGQFFNPRLLGGSSQLVSGKHGDRKSPKWGYSPYKPPKWLVNRGDPNHLQVLG